MPKRSAAAAAAGGGGGGSTSMNDDPPFLPLEETMVDDSRASTASASAAGAASSTDKDETSPSASAWDQRTSARRMNWESVDSYAASGSRSNKNNKNNNYGDTDSEYDDGSDFDDQTSSSHSITRTKKKFSTSTPAGSAAVSTGHIAVSQLPRRMVSSLPCPKLNMKKLIMTLLMTMFVTIIYQSFFVSPENRLIQPDFCDKFLDWVETNPIAGLGAILLVIASAVVSMVPIGTPLVLGCGFIYRGVYGWKLGLFVSTAVSMLGSTLGAVVCFLLGRYLMRDTVKRWVRNYPLFDAIDVAASENGLKIMAMLYLTPVLPLGLVSYMCGTTSIALFDFAAAKIASLPLYLIYTFIGASAHSFIKRGGDNNDSNAGIGASVADEAKKLEENQYLLMSGLILSIAMMTLITRYIRKELMKILDQQKKEKTEEGSTQPLLSSDDDGNDNAIEMGLTSRRRAK